MATKIQKYFTLFLYGILVLFVGEIIMLSYSRSTMQMHMNNSMKRENPEAYVLFNFILLILAHLAMIALNFFVWYSLLKFLFQW